MLPPDDPSALPPVTTAVDPVPREASSHGERHRRIYDALDIGTGAGLALAVVGLMGAASLRLGGEEGNVAASVTPPRESVVIETRILQRGGGEFDPRRIVHRQAPVLAEREAPRPVAPTVDPTAVRLPTDAGAQDYMAAITGRTRQGRGNQDLAERIAAMAASEQAADPSSVGPGSPTGSAVGDTTDPTLATRGAATKIDEFLRTNIRVSSALTGSERRTVVFRIRIDEAGAITLAELVQASGNDSLDGEILGQAQRLATSHARIESLSPEEITQVQGRNINVRVPIDRMSH